MNWLHSIYNKLSRQHYRTLNTIEVSASALRHNHAVLQKIHPESRVCPVLKSNAYGHGISQVAPVFDSLNVPFLLVDSLYEAYRLTDAGVSTPILILGYTYPTNYAYKKLPYHFVVYDWETALALDAYQRNVPVHLFVDTGMHREGVPLSELREFVRKLKGLKNITVVGLASHFADADNPESQDFSQAQEKNYYEAVNILHQEGLDPHWKHISASAGLSRVFDPRCSLIRAGLASYGLSPLASLDSKVNLYQDLQPALTFYSTLVQIKNLSAGEKVGYNCTYVADKDRVIGLLPAGYYEGVDRRLSNKGFVKVKDTFCPILGRVSMNMTVVDLSEVESPEVGDQVTMYSATVGDKNSLQASADLAGTIPYELLVKLAESVRRVVNI